MKHLEYFSGWVTRWTGSNQAFLLATLIIIIWAISGPFFDYSDFWQLTVNTGTTIVTFLMVFLIQRSQNKDSLAIHAKLDELIASQPGARNKIIRIEDLPEEEIRELHKRFRKLKLEGNNTIELK